MTGAEQNDPIEFRRLLEQIASKAAAHGLDLHAKVTPGSRTTLLTATYKAEKAAIKEGAKKERADHGIAFPDIDERDGLPRKDSVPNTVAWLEHYDHQIWFDEFADEVMLGKKPVDDSRMPEKWLHNFGRRDKWIVCLTAGTVVPANQEKS